MRKGKQKQASQASGLWEMRAVENALLVGVLAIAVLRATFTETPHVETMGHAGALSNEATSLLLSSALLAALAVWVIVGAITGRLRWRRTYFAGAVGVFCAAGLVGVWLASDKRAALTDLVVMASGPVAGWLAVQLLDRKEKVRLFLWLLLAVGAAAAYACYDKMTSSGNLLVVEYEKSPEAFLGRLGIEPGSLEQWQYEHRLYSRDVSGFLTTSNSTGSFFLLAVFAGIGLCVEAFGMRRSSEETRVALVCFVLATALSLAGLLMTQSKGAVGALIVFVPIGGVCAVFGKTLWTHRRMVCAAVVILAAAAIAAMTIYGMRHGRLPGGNSMLVRWQYWTTSAQMAKEYPLFGTAGGNYAAHYLAYKHPAAPETISDPHNWVFSLLCRFGLIGLAAMGVALLRPAAKMLAAAATAEKNTAHAPPCGQGHFWLMLMGGVLAVMLAIRPGLLYSGVTTETAIEQSAAYLLLIIVPAGIVALVFGLLRFAGMGDLSANGTNRRLIIALACGLGAVLLHNLVDFALFEPGVWTMFWLTTAAGIALAEGQNEDGGYRVTALKPGGRIAVALVPVAAIAAVVVFAIVPGVRRGTLVYRAIRAVTADQAQTLLEQATAVDSLSPSAAITGARLMQYRYEQRTIVRYPAMVDSARRFAETAIERSPADPRPRRLLAEILLAEAEAAEHEARKRSLREDAYAAMQEAVRRYPGSDVLNYRLGVLAEELGQDIEAIQYLERTLEIETAYRAQFLLMYPQQQDVVSRLGQKAYDDITNRLKRLRRHQSNTGDESEKTDSP